MQGENLSINIKKISQTLKLNVLKRLLQNNEMFHVACSKSGLSISNAKKLLNNNKCINEI